jgi:hypothetical protein
MVLVAVVTPAVGVVYDEGDEFLLVVGRLVLRRAFWID